MVVSIDKEKNIGDMAYANKCTFHLSKGNVYFT